MKKLSIVCMVVLISCFLVNPAIIIAGWYEMMETPDTLTDVWGSSENDVFAVGHGGTILHYDGSTWSPMEISSPLFDLEGVWGSSATDVFAVGDFGTILHYDGLIWSEMESGTGAILRSVWGSSGTDVFAVGFMGLSDRTGIILHYDGSTWSEMESGTDVLYRVWGSSATDVFAVGDFGTILHHDGYTWAEMESDTTDQLRGVWGSSESDVFAVGDFTVLHYDGNDWSRNADEMIKTFSYYAVWGSSASDVYAWGFPRLHYDGVEWSFQGLVPFYYCFGIWGSSSTNIFAVGRKFVEDEYRGGIYHYIIDTDSDGVADEVDNCPEIPNGPLLGTCYSWSGMEEGTTCRNDTDCGNLPESCSMSLEDSNGNGLGDVCDLFNLFFDIKPGSCPNPMRLKCNGVLPVAILGTDDLDVTTINPDTIMLTREGVIGGVPLTRNSYEDVATPFEGELCDCHTLRKDGYMDLTLKFMVGDVVEELMLYEFSDRETIPLTIVGETYGGTPIRGEDCIRIIGDLKQECNSDLDCDADVDGSDAAMFKEEFGRRNCWRNNPCIADFQVDGDVDGEDAFTFKSAFGTILVW